MGFVFLGTWGDFGICQRKAVKLWWDDAGICVPGNFGNFWDFAGPNLEVVVGGQSGSCFWEFRVFWGILQEESSDVMLR